jgi:hypothetical protein
VAKTSQGLDATKRLETRPLVANTAAWLATLDSGGHRSERRYITRSVELADPKQAVSQ